MEDVAELPRKARFTYLDEIKNEENFDVPKQVENKQYIHENIFACLFSVHNRIGLSPHEQVCLIRLRFERYFSHHRADDGRSISQNVA